MGVERNCESVVISKGQGSETSCPPHSLMDDIELREKNK